MLSVILTIAIFVLFFVIVTIISKRDDKKWKEIKSVYLTDDFPCGLTETGKSVLEQVDSEGLLELYSDYILRRMHNKLRPVCLEHVEIKASDFYLWGHKNKELLDDVKVRASVLLPIKMKDKLGNVREHEISYKEVMRILAVPIREMYLKEHPECSKRMNA